MLSVCAVPRAIYTVLSGFCRSQKTHVLLSSERRVITVSCHFGRGSVLITLVGYRHFPEVFPDNVGIEKLVLVTGS